ncbi:hypothetical protein PAMP_011106 [Pampus punctatissimus]
MAPVINSKPKTLMKVKPQPFIVEKKEEPRENIPPKVQPKPKTPTPPARPARPARTAHPPRTPTPPQEPTLEVPAFLKQFSEADWFKDLYADNKSIPSSLSPEDFSLQLLQYLNTCSTLSKIKILAALQALHSQSLIPNTDKLYQGLIDLVPTFVSPHMSHVERNTLCEILNLLVCLKSSSYNLVITLLTLLAYKKLHLRETILRMLTALGVDEAEQWLWPELEIWDSELQDQSDIWKSLCGRANCCSSQPILRLGETYSMARIRKSPGIILPPLRSRPFLTYFPNFISLPLPRVTLYPFHICSDEDWLKASPRRYFIQQQSYVEYYR